MIKFKVKKQGVYLAVKGEQVEQEVGTVLTLDTDEVPAFLVGKGEVVGENEGKELANADELLNAAMAENAELAAQLASAKSGIEQLNRDLESARGLAIEHAKNLDAANAELASAKKANESLASEIADLKKNINKR